ncbi:MAG: YhfC family glutamic-type intramembrane protease [Anaerolineales bacterium]
MTVFAYIVSVGFMILLPIVLAILLRRYVRVPWYLFCGGILTFIVSQVVHLPLNNWLTDLGLLPPQGTLTGPPLWQTALILGLTAGLCEELARTAGYAILRRARRFEDGLMLGLGHGGIEAMVLGGVITAATFSSLWGLRSTDLSSLKLSLDQLQALSTQMDALNSSAWSAFVPLVERILAMQAQVTLSVIVLQAFSRRKWLYVPLAILYHALIDGLLVYVQYTWNNALLTYAGFVLLLLPAAIWMILIAPRQRLRQAAIQIPFASELKIFWLALRKEIVQQWRSKRVLVVAAVFVLFGMGSPLLAKFTPEILKSVSGAEMFANLIPEPTIADAIGQYIKNLTQFSFIIAVLLGMGAVVGEKERNTIAMILSKPMPRWAFLMSKFTAQFLVYMLAFLVAGLGAFYYTAVLFEMPDIGQFATMNLLLFTWLLTFVAVTLLASVLGGSTGAAAGIGLGLSVVLLLASNLPRVGVLAPGGLTAWAGQLGIGAEQINANGGALAMAVVIVLVSMVVSLAVFERQEL